TVTPVSENPKLSLKLTDVTGREAFAALSRASGIPINVIGVSEPMPGEDAPPHVKILREKASFDWSDTTFARALRQLLQRYQLQVIPSGDAGYQLFPSDGAPVAARPARRVGLVEKNRLRLFLRSLGSTTGRAIDFEGAQEPSDQGSLWVRIGCELEDGDAGMLAGIANLTAKDDQGSILATDEPFPPPGGFYGARDHGNQRLPDEWSIHANLPQPHPRARKLAWLEGDVMVFKTYRTLQVQFPLPEGDKPVSTKLTDATLEILKFEAGRAAARPEGVPAPARVKARLRVPMGSQFGQQFLFSGKKPALVGASGETYAADDTNITNPETDQEGTVYTMEYAFPQVKAPVVGIRFGLVEMSEPEKLFTFRMTDIPLPPEPAFVAGRNPPPPPLDPAGAVLEGERAYYSKGGGVLVSRVLLRERPAAGGTLSLGLSRKEGAAGWSGTRWLDVDVSPDGAARLEDLKPGTYRLLRVYRPAEGPKIEGGAWQAGEVVVEVAAGKEVAPAPLRWTAEPPGKKPASGRPAV
ncbi:MAG TPA: hypothetical protein VK689_04010, partial [Armatimonadota bacterium]|nr:hypothetical protein [Armatimonadota bacterium]